MTVRCIWGWRLYEPASSTAGVQAEAERRASRPGAKSASPAFDLASRRSVEHLSNRGWRQVAS
jgi:hypothetical protein